MIPDITELNFPKKDGKQYATLTHATVKHEDMGVKTITTEVRIDGDIVPDFSYDWAVEYRGEKYVMPLRIPAGNTGELSLGDTQIELIFQHWAIYQLKRWTFVTLQPIDVGEAIADEEVASVQLDLGGFCDLFGKQLRFWYGDAIKIDLNPQWKYDPEAILIEISHSKIWDVLIVAFHEKYGVRWEIVAASDNSNTVAGGEKYVIKVGYPPRETSHIFKTGFEGGLLKIERQVQSEEIRNMLGGRGSEENLPRYYYKRVPESETGKWFSDPDWVRELDDIWFTNLRGATFRSYVQGWKAAHINETDDDGNLLYEGYTPVGENNAYAPWAYRKGYTDTKFHPVEFVADEVTLAPEDGDHVEEIWPGYKPYIKKGSSIDKYGPLPGTLDNNEEIYPTLQGTEMDIAVDVEIITTDDGSPDSTPPDVTISEFAGAKVAVSLEAGERKRVTTSPRQYFIVPVGRTANLLADSVAAEQHPDTVVVEGYDLNVYDAGGAKRSASGIPPGTYSYELEMDVHNTGSSSVLVNVGAPSMRLQDAVLAQYTGGTFDIWVKNIWNSVRQGGESDVAYAERVWKPVLGDRDGAEAAVVFTSGELALSEDYEFKIVKIPDYDPSRVWEEKDKDGNLKGTHQSHWRIRVARSDADLDSTGKYVPNKERNGKAGDHFVFIGTELTHVPYVVDAEVRLDDWKKDQLDDKKEIKPTFVVTTDRVRLGGEGKPDALVYMLRAGDSVTLEDKRLISGSERVNLYLQSLTLTYREPTSDDNALNPDVEITLGEEYASAGDPVGMMQGEITALQRQIGSVGNVEQVVRKTGDKRYLRKDASDRTPFGLIVGGGLESGTYVAGASGARIGAEGNAELADLILRGLLSSAKFADGFTGAGWRIWLADGLSRLTIDELTVRKAMHVFELLIERIRAVGGQICVSAANGKIASVEESGAWYRISFEQQAGFAAGDLIRCQTFTGMTLKSYWVEIDDTDPGGSVRIARSEFEGQSAPAPGDECVLMGNTANEARQSLVLISATEDGKPRIDVLDGVKSKSFAGCLRARLGALDGITDAAFGDDQPTGHGLYSDNVYLRGRFVLTSGEEVLTRFTVTEGKITSAVDSLRSDVDAPGNFISNPMLAGGTEGWKKLTEESLPGVEAAPASVRNDDAGRPVLYLNGSGVTQERADMRGEPEDYPAGADGKKQAVPVYLSLLVRSAAGGTLSGGLYRTLREGFETRYVTLNFERQIAASGKYVPVTVRGLWNGEGALWLKMEGAAEIYAVTLTQDRLATRYSTLFGQSDKLVKISAANFNDDGSVKQESSIVTTAEGISLGVREEIDGALRETGIDIESGKIELKSDNVTFTDSEGNVQAFIEGGKINAKAIDADELTAGKLEMYEKNTDGTRAAHPTVRITPESKGMSILDKETGALCQEFSGASHTGKEDFFGTGSGGDVSMTHSGGGVTVNGTSTAPGGSDTETELEASAVFHTDGAATVRITSGKIQAYAKAADAEITPSPGELVPTIWSTAEAEVSLVLRGYSDAACTVMTDEWEIASASALSQSRRDLSVEDDGTGGSANGTYTYTAEEKYGGADCAGRSVTTRGAGYFRLWLVYRVRATKAGSGASVKYGHYVGPALAAEYVTEVYVSRFFANGFCLGRRKDDYVAVMLGADGMRLEARNGSKGLRMTPEGGAEVLVAADASSEHWAPLPRLLCRCTYSWNASGGGYVPQYDGYCLDGNYPAPTRTGTGTVRLDMPSQWGTILGAVPAAKDLRVSVEGRNSSGVYGAVTRIQGSRIVVSLQDQSGAADGSFHLEIGLA